MAKIRIGLDVVAAIFPEANRIPFLPRKKKKALKKKISKQLIAMMELEAKDLIERVNEMNSNLFRDFASVREEMERLSEKQE